MTYIEKLNVLCANEHLDTDDDFAKKLNRIYSEIPKNIMINHNDLSNIIDRRARNYCKRNNIELENYDGPLSFRYFVIPQSKQHEKI